MSDTEPNGFRARLEFDPARGEYRDGDIRYMMIRPDALMGMIAELPAETRPLVLEAFARAIRRFGGRSARAYQDRGAADPASLLAVIAATAPELGWGRWDIAQPADGQSADGQLADGLDVTVQNSPFPAGAGAVGHPVCAPIRGMLSAVGEFALGAPVTVAETDCAAAGAPCCRFAVRRAGPSPAVGAAPRR